jgi:hypothetical protein
MNEYGLSDITNMKVEEYASKMNLVNDDLKSIPFINYYDLWADEYGGEVLKDMYCLFMESYSGGEIEAYQYGFTEEAFTTDRVQAYPSEVLELWDLRGAKITWGEGEPPHIPNSYCFVRGDMDCPETLDYHPLTVKHSLFKNTNVRGVGEYRASYLLGERDFMIKYGATFSNEKWYNIETLGKPSPLAIVMRKLIDMREALRQEKKDHVAKTTSASVYGLTIEAVDTFIMDSKNVIRDGYRAGEFFNPIIASVITSGVRVKMSEAMRIIS